MTAKKQPADAPEDEAAAGEEAALTVPKGDDDETTVADEVMADDLPTTGAPEPDDDAFDQLEEIPEAPTDSTIDPSIPPPVHPQSTPSAAQDRVLYENWVNAEAEAFVVTARQTFLDALLAGKQPGDVEIVVN